VPTADSANGDSSKELSNKTKPLRGFTVKNGKTSIKNC
jgi:hypothetical protein